MCTSSMVCYGDITKKTKKCGSAPFFITNDGKYAVPQEFVKLDEYGEPIYPGKDIPKYEINILRSEFPKE